MSAITKSYSSLRVRGGAFQRSTRVSSQYGRSQAGRRYSALLPQALDSRFQQRACSPLQPLSNITPIWQPHSQFLPQGFLVRSSLLATKQFHSRPTFFQAEKSNDPVKDPPRQDSPSESASSAESAKASSDGPASESKSSSSGGESGEKSGEQKEQDSKKEEKKDEAPPPPHGDKSPYQVFMDTLRSEFKASKEWNEGTKALASSAHNFTQNESLQRAKNAYSTASGAATSTTGKVLKTTGKAIGQTAAWTWDTLPVKGIRAGVSATGRGLEQITRPVRQTEAYKSVRDVIDDGSSSRYGGWTEKEQRRKRREARELQEAARTGRPIRKAEKMEEDPDAGTNITLHKDAAWKESWKSFKDQSRVMQSIFSLKSTYAESENPLISTARSITDRVAGFFAENETAMVIKKFREMDPSFQLEPFLQDMREYILPEILDAYVKGDVETLKQWLSAAQYQVYAALMHQYTTNGLKSDGKILDIRNVDVLSARLLDPGEIPVFILTCRTQEVHVYRNAKTGDLAAGMEDRVQQVTYAIGVTRIPEDVSNPETRGWRLIELQKSAR